MPVAEAVATTGPLTLPARPRRAAHVIAVAPFALALAVGLWGIRRQNTLWGDEAVTYDLAHRDLAQIWRTAQHIDLVHALYYAVMHGVFGVLGDGLVPLRLPSVLATAAAASAVALIGLRLAGPRAGLLAGLVLPLLPQVQKYAQEGRSYALVCALVAWATYALLARRWTIYGVTMLLACLLHEFAVLALAAHGVTLAVSRRRLKAWGTTAACVVAGLLPLAVASAGQSDQVAWIGAPVRLSDVLVMGCVGVACARTPVRARGPVRLAALAVPLVVVPTLLLLTASLVKPLFVDRYVLYGSIGVALLLGAALDHLLRLSPRFACLAALAALAALIPLSLSLRTPESRTNDATAVTAAVREEARPGDGILYLTGRHRFLSPAGSLTDLALAQDPASSNTLAGVELPGREIAVRMLDFDRIVVVDATGGHVSDDPREAAKTNTLRDHFRAYRTTRVSGASVTVYVRR
ncbi:hypothetical protein [Streptomyces sp. 4F14]|uniref:hypothetical protein n=1 Tax=Streptomyces sp. 4F14 TaxID=3394380 RepID=UPI003A8BD18D